MEVYTIGHSTRGADEFLGLLRSHSIRCVADVRGYPGSHRYPHFGMKRLARFLDESEIGYHHVPLLGGRRHASTASELSSGWHNESFRAYAEYMRTEAFERGLDGLLGLAGSCTTAMMCAEAVPWRCHRWLISDALVVRGVDVRHVLGSGRARPHEITRWARLDDGRVTYPPASD